MFEFDDLERCLPPSPYEDLEGAIAERGLQPDLTADDVSDYDQAMRNARIERMGGALLLHSRQRPPDCDDYASVAKERGLDEGAGWSDIAQSYRQPAAGEDAPE